MRSPLAAGDCRTPESTSRAKQSQTGIEVARANNSQARVELAVPSLVALADGTETCGGEIAQNSVITAKYLGSDGANRTAMHYVESRRGRIGGAKFERSRTMAMSRKSAEIYQFPPRGRFAAAQDRTHAEPVSTGAAPRLAATFGNWYHEEAIREAARDRKS